LRSIIIGTAGHIDHGKTTLIKALTGRSTDTLHEEIKRGISINLGFTYFDLPSGLRAGIVDVPGHERFIRNMLAGAMGIDIALLVVAANEGVMPQTIEHADILEFLDIKARMIVLTKCGVVDDEMRELAAMDTRESLAGTSFADARMIEVDSLTGFGLDELISVIDEEAGCTLMRNSQAPARLPVDRVFSMKGFGTIVTGTLWEGTVTVGDELMLYPQEIKARVRAVQVHEQNAQTAYAGQRVALNLPEFGVGDLSRGDVLAKPESLEVSQSFDAKIKLVPHTNRRLRMWDRIRAYLGASEVMARFVPLDGIGVDAGGECYCQLRLERPTAVKRMDRLVIRFYSPMETIGGGVVLDPTPARHARLDDATLTLLKTKEHGSPTDVTEGYIRQKGEDGAEAKAIADYASSTADDIKTELGELIENGIAFEILARYYHVDTVQNTMDAILSQLSDYHKKNPLKPGMGKEEVRRRIKSRLKPKAIAEILKLMENDGLIKAPNSTDIALSGFEIRLTLAQKSLADVIERELLEAGFSPPPLKEQGRSLEYDQIMEMLLGERLVRLDRDTAIHREYYDRALEIAISQLRESGELKLADFRDTLGISRKYTMLLLDDFDKRRITVRNGEVRVPGEAFAGFAGVIAKT